MVSRKRFNCYCLKFQSHSDLSLKKYLLSAKMLKLVKQLLFLNKLELFIYFISLQKLFIRSFMFFSNLTLQTLFKNRLDLIKLFKGFQTNYLICKIVFFWYLFFVKKIVAFLN